MNPLKRLEACGPSPWLGYLRRRLIETGGSGRVLEDSGLKGVTTNPSIFEKEIGESDEYPDVFDRSQARAHHSVSETRKHLAIADIRAPADGLPPLYEEAPGRDGDVSLKCSPYLANDVIAVTAEALRSGAAEARSNLMVKVWRLLPAFPPSARARNWLAPWISLSSSGTSVKD